MPARRVEVVVEPGALTDDGADGVVFLLAANPGRAGPAAGQGRVGR